MNPPRTDTHVCDGGEVLATPDCTTFGPDCACNGPVESKPCPACSWAGSPFGGVEAGYDKP